MSAEDVVPDALELFRSFSIFINVDFCAVGVSLCITAATISSFRRLLPEPRRKKLPFLLLSIVLSGLYVTNGVLDTYIVKTFLAFWVSEVDEAALYALLTPNATNSIVQTVASALANCTMIYRCYFLYSDRVWVLVVPILMECTSIGIGLFMAACDISTTEFSLDNHETSTLVASWFFLTISVDAIVTGLIVLKIVLVQRRTTNNLQGMYMTGSPGSTNIDKSRVWGRNGRKRSHHDAYMGVVGILVESSLPMAVMGIMAGVVRLTGQKWILVAVSESLWFALYTLCPQMMIFRLMRGRALEVHNGGYTSGTGEPISQPLAFAQHTTQESIRLELLPQT
ncbi:hypothetical protein DFP72DRAFT_896401 [Ephemerocybe angulata]|uniref:Uncharacterized protein n=1 Tax=Ephemerocybe angulata TaxID=980116 RepID=A0A8H6M7U1_9AGAR|nr:hypothetical protein DFP72DRAFT_896401 [Tulosesus angulatus]